VALTLPASAAAARLLQLTAGRVAVDRHPLAAEPTAANPQQRRAAAGWDGRTDGRTLDSCIDPAPHTMRAVPITTTPTGHMLKLTH